MASMTNISAGFIPSTSTLLSFTKRTTPSDHLTSHPIQKVPCKVRQQCSSQIHMNSHEHYEQYYYSPFEFENCNTNDNILYSQYESSGELCLSLPSTIEQLYTAPTSGSYSSPMSSPVNSPMKSQQPARMNEYNIPFFNPNPFYSAEPANSQHFPVNSPVESGSLSSNEESLGVVGASWEVKAPKHMEEVTSDGGIRKQVLRKGLPSEETIGLDIIDGVTVKVHYTGRLHDRCGHQFVCSKSLENGQPIECVIGERELISGLNIALKSMTLGEKSAFFIMPQYGYEEFPTIVPSNTPLYFEIELMEIDASTVVYKPPNMQGFLPLFMAN